MTADFSDQVWALCGWMPLIQQYLDAKLIGFGARVPMEIVWLLPHDAAQAEAGLPADAPALPRLFGLPAVTDLGVDRPMLAIRPVQPPAGAHQIRTGAVQALTDYDRETDPYFTDPPL